MATFCTNTLTISAVSCCTPATAAAASATSSCITSCTPATRPAAIHTTKGWPQGQHIRQQRYSSPFIQNLNPSAQSFVPAAEAQQNSVPNTKEPRVPKSADGKGVKNSSTMDKVCFQCKQPGHLKKDCPELPYCSKCRTKGHVPAKCPLKNQDKQQQDERCKNNQDTAEMHES